MKKYVLCPGHVTSKTDGQVHWVGARQLAFLYCVPMDECYIDTPGSTWKVGQSQEHLDSLTWLFPDYDGLYKTPAR